MVLDLCTFSTFIYIIIVYCQTRFNLLLSKIMPYRYKVIDFVNTVYMKRIMELSYQGTFVPGNESSIGGTFVPGNFRSLELSFQEPSFPGTFVLKSEIYMELSFPNSKIIIFNKLNTLRRRHNLIVYLLMHRPTLMM